MEDNIHIKARKILDRYLEENQLRKTPERYAILETVYNIKGAFALDELSEMLALSNFRVSRATIYNNIRFFLKLRLVVRHRFMDGTRYSAGLLRQNFCHQVCTVCGAVKEIQIPALARTVNEARFRKFHHDTFALYIYGVCAKCQARQARKNVGTNKLENRKTKL